LTLLMFDWHNFRVLSGDFERELQEQYFSPSKREDSTLPLTPHRPRDEERPSSVPIYWPPAPQLFHWSFSVIWGEVRQFFPIKRDMMSQLHPPCLLLSYREDSRLQLCCLQSLIPLSSRHFSVLLADLHWLLLTRIASLPFVFLIVIYPVILLELTSA
jgi:hypothetical protein